MKPFTLNVVLFISFFFVQLTLSYGREEIDMPINEEEMESTLRRNNKSVMEDDSGPITENGNGNLIRDVVNNGEEEESIDDQSSLKRTDREKNPKKRSHPQVCPPGWISPSDYDGGNPNCCGCGCGGCGCGCGSGRCGCGCGCGGCSCSGCGCNGHFGGCGAVGGCGECGCGEGCGCGCGGCGCKFHGGFMQHNRFGRRLPRVINDGGVQHIFLRDGRMGRHIPSPLLIRRNILC